jgi:hypothetical protein
MENRYLVYKITGGLCHMLWQINNSVYLSRITGRMLIIDCFSNAFCDDFNRYFNIPGFQYATNYDCLYQDESLNKEDFEPYTKAVARCVGSDYFLNNKLLVDNIDDVQKSNDRIVYCTWMKNVKEVDIPWHVKLNKDVVDIVSANEIDGKYIGVHYRNTDMKHKLEDFIPKILELSAQSTTVYLGTDDSTAFDRLNTLLDNKFKIIQYTKPMNYNGQNIHYSNPNKYEVTINGLVDMYHLTRATFFIPSVNSSFSRRIMLLRIKDDFFN